MSVKLKPLGEQVVVITGASSGIGLATAEMAAKRGARVVLSSRDESDLRTAGERIRAEGGQAAWFAADVADLEAMRRLAQLALTEFGAIDTWVNNAGVSIVGRLEDVSLEDARRLFETNYWGVVHGSLVALPHLEAGGALINIGSILSDTGYPLQGHYTASKHAVKGFTDSLRLEVEEPGRPISVTLIQPAAIDTLYPEHAKSYLGVEPKHMPPVYAPEVVARAILHCAEHPERDVLVGEERRCSRSPSRSRPAWATGSRRRRISAVSTATSPTGARTRCTRRAPATDACEATIQAGCSSAVRTPPRGSIATGLSWALR